MNKSCEGEKFFGQSVFKGESCIVHFLHPSQFPGNVVPVFSWNALKRRWLILRDGASRGRIQCGFIYLRKFSLHILKKKNPHASSLQSWILSALWDLLK